MSPDVPGPPLPDRYRVVRHIARGGMASVWAAEDGLLGRLVAVKVLAGHIAEDPGARRRFDREARTAARVGGHPNVVTIYDVGEHADLPFIVMELFTGSVADRLGEGVPLPRAVALDWLAQAAAGLDHAHAEDVVHRDVKPANLLLDHRSRLAVADFGIARLVDESALTQAGVMLGTAAYLSPEQARGEPATAASDRYALGIVAFELLTGRRPFTGPTVPAQARAHLEAPVPASGLGPEVDDVLARALAKDPEARYLTSGRFVDELRAASARPVAATTIAAQLPPIAPTGPPPHPHLPHPHLPHRQRQATGAPSARLAPVADPPAGASGPVRTHRSGSGRARTALLGGLAALALAGGVTAAVIAGGGDDGDGERAGGTSTATEPERTRQRTRTATRTQAAPDVAPAPPATTDAAPATPTATTEATPPADTAPDAEPEGGPGPATAGNESPEELNDRGFAALRAGDAATAVTLLEQANQGFFRQGDAANRLLWGYTLFNLGQAYEAAGRPADAVGAYESRLQVSPNDQRADVQRALRRARRAAAG